MYCWFVAEGLTSRQLSHTANTQPLGDHCTPARSWVSVSKCWDEVRRLCEAIGLMTQISTLSTVYYTFLSKRTTQYILGLQSYTFLLQMLGTHPKLRNHKTNTLAILKRYIDPDSNLIHTIVSQYQYGITD